MYSSFYGLHERPFDLTPNPKYLFLSRGHREALSNVEYGISGRKGITLFTGEAGTGKTTILRAALTTLRHPDATCVYLSNPTLTRPEFYEFLAGGFGLSDLMRWKATIEQQSFSPSTRNSLSASSSSPC